MFGDPDDRGTMVDELESTETQEGDGGGGFNIGALLPGGIAPGPQELAVAAIILGALGFVILARRGFKPVLNK